MKTFFSSIESNGHFHWKWILQIFNNSVFHHWWLKYFMAWTFHDFKILANSFMHMKVLWFYSNLQTVSNSISSASEGSSSTDSASSASGSMASPSSSSSSSLSYQKQTNIILKGLYDYNWLNLTLDLPVRSCLTKGKLN